MKTIKTLTVGGETYAIGFLDDTKVADGGWSAKKLIDTLCPTFAVTGKTVSCYPVEGYPLEMVSRIVPTQTGNPTMGDPVPIQGKQSLSVTHNEEQITAALGETVYGGTYNWQTGELELNYGIYTMTGQETFRIYQSIFLAYPGDTVNNHGTSDGFCSHGSYNGYQTGCWCVNYNSVIYVPNGDYSIDDSGLQSFKNDVIAQYENGTPIQLCYKLSKPIRVQLEPRDIWSKAGENAFSSEEEITVRGRWDLQKLLEGAVQ